MNTMTGAAAGYATSLGRYINKQPAWATTAVYSLSRRSIILHAFPSAVSHTHLLLSVQHNTCITFT